MKKFIISTFLGMMKEYYPGLLALALIITLSSCRSGRVEAQSNKKQALQMIYAGDLLSGAERTGLYFPYLKDKKVGVVCNHTSMIGHTHLVDSLISAGIHISLIFSPEHGFRGNAEAGAEINDDHDLRTGIRLISLYGKKKKPLPDDLEGIDLLIFDIQDVGVRFYTYISTMTLVMEAAADAAIPLILLDRPNPNGFYIDGPVLDTNFRSFVGMHSVPVVYGMTIGEYATMINEEGWLAGKRCNLSVIPVEGYNHNMLVKLKEKPSPNLPDWMSVYLYPSLCFFEGTMISVGRGTDFPFQVYGHPDYLAGSFIFTPVSIPGVAEKPPYEGRACYGASLSGFTWNFYKNENHLELGWLIGMHEYFKDSANFFNPYFDKLAGNDRLRNDIIEGKTQDEIRASWQYDIDRFRVIREKYLLYPE